MVSNVEPINPDEDKPKRKPRKPKLKPRPLGPPQPGELISVDRKDETPLRLLSAWVIYRLMRDGKLPHVKVGRSRYMTLEGIAAFLATGGEGSDFSPAIKSAAAAATHAGPVLK